MFPLSWLQAPAPPICSQHRGGGGFIPAPLDLYKEKAPAGLCLQHLSSWLPWDCFWSTEEPKLARDKGSAFPADVLRGPTSSRRCGTRADLDAICSSLRFHPVLGRGGKSEKGMGQQDPSIWGFSIRFKASVLMWGPSSSRTVRSPGSLHPSSPVSRMRIFWVCIPGLQTVMSGCFIREDFECSQKVLKLRKGLSKSTGPLRTAHAPCLMPLAHRKIFIK